MKFNEELITGNRDRNTGAWVMTGTAVCKYAEWGKWHTNDCGNGLFYGDPYTMEGERQVLGTCDFSVAGCKTEKAAVAKVRNAAKRRFLAE